MNFKNCVILSSIALCGFFAIAQSEENNESLKMSNKQYILMPKVCRVHSEKVLKANDLKEHANYSFLKTIYSGEAYKDIYGVLELSKLENRGEAKFMSVYKGILDACFANASIGIPRTKSGSEWSELSDFIIELNDLDVKIHEVKITEELIRIFVDKDDLDQKRQAKIDSWLNGND